MKRGDAIHLAAQEHIDSLDLEQLNKYVYDSVVIQLEAMDNIDLEFTIGKVFPSVASKMMSIE